MKSKTFKFKWFWIRFWVSSETDGGMWGIILPLIYGQGGPVDPVDRTVWFGLGFVFVYWAIGFEILSPE